MISFTQNQNSNTATAVRILGIGNAGVHLADLVVMAGLRSVEVVAINTDAQSLSASVAPKKILLGARSLRGLGASGDPEIGHEAAIESIEEIHSACSGAPIILLVAGLGGGTASSVAPLIVQTAKEMGAYVICLATTPFDFEGRRRLSQATQARKILALKSDIFLCFDNNRMSDIAAPRANIEETFSAADTLLAKCVTSIVEMFAAHGPVPVNFSSTARALKTGSQSFFGRGESSSRNRAAEAIEQALSSPLLDRGSILKNAAAIVAHISGPASLSFAETSAAMREITKNAPAHAAIFFGVSVDDSDSLRVTVLGTCSPSATASAAAQVSLPTAPAVIPTPAVLAADITVDAQVTSPILPTPARPILPTPAKSDPTELSLFPDLPPATKPQRSRKSAAKDDQPMLPLDPDKGTRFEKSEPTIVAGEDLDIPAYLRAEK